LARYPNIGDHGLIGDLQTAALVSTDGVLDWFCCPRFDSPSVFASLLDAERGGFYRIAPDRDDYVTRQLYLPDTAILVTRFMTPDGVGEVHDFMPVIEGAATDRHRLVRNIRVVRGVMRFAIQIEPRFDYGRARHTQEITDQGAVFRSDGLELTMHGIAPEGSSVRDLGLTPVADGEGLRWTRTFREGEAGGVVLESMGGAPRLVAPAQAQRMADDTARFWRAWLARSTYRGRWREMVARSAITLKLMTYQPAGAPVPRPRSGSPSRTASGTGTTGSAGSEMGR
jgi:GH15 family glucan-1,4-alpha-glucosidase